MAGEAFGHQGKEVGELGAVGELVVAGLEVQLDGLGGEEVGELVVQGGGGQLEGVLLVDGEGVEVGHRGGSQLARWSVRVGGVAGRVEVADQGVGDGGADELHRR